ncbi:MAG: hypothetical protein RL005_349 [Planctomycetota bacterium]
MPCRHMVPSARRSGGLLHALEAVTRDPAEEVRILQASTTWPPVVRRMALRVSTTSGAFAATAW